MSFEYSLSIFNIPVDEFIRRLGSSNLAVESDEQCVVLKDPDSGSGWRHDVRVFREKGGGVFLEVTTPTGRIYREVKSSLQGARFILTEYEDDEEITLESAFGLGG